MDRDKRSRRQNQGRENEAGGCHATPETRPRITQGQARVLMKFLNQNFDPDLLTSSPSSFDTTSSDESSLFEANVQWIADMVVRSVMEGRQVATTPAKVGRNGDRVPAPVVSSSPPFPSASDRRDTSLRMPMRGLASIRKLNDLGEEEKRVLELPRSPSWDLQETRDQALKLPSRRHDSSRSLDQDDDDFKASTIHAGEVASRNDAPVKVPYRGDEESIDEIDLDDLVGFSSEERVDGPRALERLEGGTFGASEEHEPNVRSTEGDLTDRESTLSGSNSALPSVESMSTWSASMAELVIDSFLSKQVAASATSTGTSRRNRDIVLRLPFSVRELENESAGTEHSEIRRLSATTTESVTDNTSEEPLIALSSNGAADSSIFDRVKVLETPTDGVFEDTYLSYDDVNPDQFSFLADILGLGDDLVLDDAVSAVSELSGATEPPPTEPPMLSEETGTSSALPPKYPQRMRSLKGSHSFDESHDNHHSSMGSVERASHNQKEVAKRTSIVTFSTIEVRLYERVLSDNPACSSGPSVGIGWSYSDASISLRIDEYEKSREGQVRSVADLQLSRPRRERLVREWGYTDREIAASLRDQNRVRFGRRQTANNLGAERLEEAVETLRNKVKKALFLHREQQKLQKQLTKQMQRYHEELLVHGRTVVTKPQPPEASSLRATPSPEPDDGVIEL